MERTSQSESTPLLTDNTFDMPEPDLESGAISETEDDVVPPTRLQSLRSRLQALLESHRTHIAILVLVLIDLAVVITEIVVLFMEKEECHPHAAEEEALWLRVMLGISVAILCIFVLEHLLRLFAFGPWYYIKNPLHAFDALVIVGSLVAELVLRGAAREVVGLLIALRCWRLVRVIDGVATAINEEKEEKIKHLKKENNKLRLEIEGLRKRIGIAEDGRTLSADTVTG